jgi:hypothetical protein
MNTEFNHIIKELKNHIKIFDITLEKNNKKAKIVCEVDRIQSIARSIVSRIVNKHGDYNISSTTKNTKNLGFTKIIISRG